MYIYLREYVCNYSYIYVVNEKIQSKSVYIPKNIATELDLLLKILMQFCPRANFQQGLL